MATYEVCFIFNRCYVQKRVELRENVSIIPLAPTGFTGDIHDARRLLNQLSFRLTRLDLERTIKHFAATGPSVAIRFSDVEADSFQSAIEQCEENADAAAGSLAVLSANPAIPVCAFARSTGDSGVKFFIPPDRQIRHGTNIAGYLDAVPEIERHAREDPKFGLLLRLYRASLREREIDNQILFQLILLEEASDEETGTFAERLRHFADRHGFSGDLAVIAAETGIVLPPGKDVIDMLVKLRNAAAHNGRIDEESLRNYKGEWVIPLLADKARLHRVIGEAIRYMFCALVGHTQRPRLHS